MRAPSRLIPYLLGLVSALVGLGAVSVPARADSAAFVGVNLQPLQQNAAISEDRWGSFLQPLADGRMNIDRIQADWAVIEPKPPVNGVHTWQWNANGGGRDSMDWTITQMASRGLRAYPTLNNSPTWARASGNALPDSSFSGFASFSIAYIQRYGEGGTFWAEHPELPQLPATAFELWNEANSGNFWTGHADAAAYARFLQAVYPAIKAQVPYATLMSSIGWPDAANYLGAVFANGGGGSMDAVAFHPYAPSARAMMGLVSSLRSTLAGLGRADLPIHITESGQPANLAGAGPLHAYTGPVNDPTRAATQSLTADALARSDCGVNSFLVYAVTGTETSKEILNEGFMGILRYADASPNATGQALQRASQRWASAVDAGTATSNGRLAVCGQGVTPPAALLPLTLQGQRGSSGGCVAGTTDYDGNPAEEVDLVLTTPDGRVSRNGTDANGQTESCVPAGPHVEYVDVYSELKNVARSPTLRCEIPVKNCAQPVAGIAGVTPGCTVRLKLTRPILDRVGKKATSRVSAKLNCTAYLSKKTVKVKIRLKGKTKSGKPRYRVKNVSRTIQPRFSVAYKVKGKQRETRLRYVTLLHGKTVRFTLHRVIKKGDQMAVVHVANPKKDKLPRVRVAATLPKPKAAPKVKKK